MTNQSVPPDVKALLRGLGWDLDAIAIAAETDLDAQGNEASHWLLATPVRWAVVCEASAATAVREGTLSEVESFRPDGAVGSGFLQAKIGGAWVDLVRYPTAQAAAKCRQLEFMRQAADSTDDAN